MGTSRGDLARALLEGVAFSLRDCHRTITDMRLPVSEYILIGGGAKSRLWSRILCDLFQAPCSVPAASDASFGSALLAGVGIGIFPDAITAITTSLRLDRRLTPDLDMAPFYQRQFERYRQIHDALAPLPEQHPKGKKTVCVTGTGRSFAASPRLSQRLRPLRVRRQPMRRAIAASWMRQGNQWRPD